MKGKLLLSGQALSLERAERLLFCNLSIEIHSGEAVRLSGANGSGKTSLLKLLGGLLSIQQGKVNRFADMRFIGHQEALADELTVYEAMQWFAFLFAGDLKAIEEALDFFALLPYRNQLCIELSMGQRRLCSLASLMLSQQPLWLLDEPFAGLSKDAAASLVKLLDKHLHNGGGIIYTDHQQVYGGKEICLEDYAAA